MRRCSAVQRGPCWLPGPGALLAPASPGVPIPAHDRTTTPHPHIRERSRILAPPLPLARKGQRTCQSVKAQAATRGFRWGRLERRSIPRVTGHPPHGRGERTQHAAAQWLTPRGSPDLGPGHRKDHRLPMKNRLTGARRFYIMERHSAIWKREMAATVRSIDQARLDVLDALLSRGWR